jgi:hypothetical protein
VAQVMEHLPSKQETMSTTPCTTTKIIKKNVSYCVGFQLYVSPFMKNKIKLVYETSPWFIQNPVASLGGKEPFHLAGRIQQKQNLCLIHCKIH